MQPARIVVAGALLVGLGGLPAAHCDEEKVPLDRLPKAVTAAVRQRFPNAELKSAGKEVEGGKTVYEVAIRAGGQGLEVTLTPDGTIVEIEKQIKAGRLPRAVAAALRDKYPNATYQMVEQVIKVKDGKETLEYYEVLLVSADRKKVEVSVSPAGKIVKEEDKGKEKDG